MAVKDHFGPEHVEKGLPTGASIIDGKDLTVGTPYATARLPSIGAKKEHVHHPIKE